jgi:succinyl-CoA synthetase alpha subunit
MRTMRLDSAACVSGRDKRYPLPAEAAHKGKIAPVGRNDGCSREILGERHQAGIGKIHSIRHDMVSNTALDSSLRSE